MPYIKTKISPELHRWLKAEAAFRGMFLNDYVRAVLMEARKKERGGKR